MTKQEILEIISEYGYDWREAIVSVAIDFQRPSNERAKAVPSIHALQELIYLSEGKCPKCGGHKDVQVEFGSDERMTCPTCNGKGVPNE